jgi:hypothetical protein
MHRRRVVTLAAAFLAMGGAIEAQTGVLYTYHGTTAGLTLLGNAATAATSDGTVLRVAPALFGQNGAVYYTPPVPLGSGDTFSTQFQFRFTNQRRHRIRHLRKRRHRLQQQPRLHRPQWRPHRYPLVNVYGVANCDFSNGYTQPGCMANGDLWTANISYDGAHLTVTLSDPREGTAFTALNNYAINLASILDRIRRNPDSRPAPGRVGRTTMW